MTGRAKTVLVEGLGTGTQAQVTSVLVRPHAGPRRNRLRFDGQCTFDRSAAAHIRKTVLPVIDDVLGGLGCDPVALDIAIVPPSAATVAETPVRVSGYSADVPVMLAMFSAVLGVEVPQEVLSTGQVGSVDGDILPVQRLVEKVEVARADGSIQTFIYPRLDRDQGFARLLPRERQLAEDAVILGRNGMNMVAVGDVADLVQAAFPDESLVLAGLRLGIFGEAPQAGAGATAVARTVQYLLGDSEGRFRRVLEEALFSEREDAAKALLGERVRLHLTRHTYPSGLGAWLRHVVASLPSTLRWQMRFPLIAVEECIRVSQYAGPSDHDDVGWLFDAVRGQTPTATAEPPATREPSPHVVLSDDGILAGVLSQIGAAALTAIARPIDTARATYTFDRVTVGADEAEFHEVVGSFYLHLLRHSRLLAGSSDPAAAQAEGLDLVERAFAGRGGERAALAEGQDALHGGMRHVLDAMTEQFKKEEMEKHVAAVIRTSMDPRSWDERVAFTAAFLRKFGPLLPLDVAQASPEAFVEHYEVIVRAYVGVLGQVAERFRSL